MTRIIIGEGVGLAVGLIGFLSIPYFWPEVPMMTRWGSCYGTGSLALLSASSA